ncbi:MAG: phospholipase D-like domain-containing protein [Euryarchaeota archaeon]|nr:phospholipase D-like domain-containing protein [Euryarchaeota archaeon]
MDSIEDSLHAMINKAEFEIVLVTPWIKQGVWNRFRWGIYDFIKNGGKLLVFINGTDEDFSSERSDLSVVNEIRKHGGVVKYVPEFHAKLYVVDCREALICSANFSWHGLDKNYEAGCGLVIRGSLRM